MTCGALAVGPAIMPRTIRPGFGRVLSPARFASEAGSDDRGLSVSSHAGAAAGGLPAGRACAGLLPCGGLLGDTTVPSTSPS